MRAFKVLQDRYPDVMLVNSWYNHWAASMQTMTASPHIRFDPQSGDYMRSWSRCSSTTASIPSRVMTLPPLPNIMMTRIYRNTDIGVFPEPVRGGNEPRADGIHGVRQAGDCIISPRGTGMS